ncbi:hypothetical protein [Crinalium epipsammum]|uniref:hypothetical protein n=1 Tax=Crinalium epipsammum TaxID=241425 RepID=UPI0002D75416|nr:hypothetical protein [Crinalium epipsammum]
MPSVEYTPIKRDSLLTTLRDRTITVIFMAQNLRKNGLFTPSARARLPSPYYI